MIVAVTGGSGFVGQPLIERLRAEGHTVRSLGRRPVPGAEHHPWVAGAGEPPPASLDGADALLHLAGEPVAQRWSAEVRRRIRDTRVRGTRELVQALSTLSRRPRVLVAASAIGIYGDRGDEILTEASVPGKGFLADVCRQWEAEAEMAESLGMRVVRVRIGVVLGREGGALASMLPVFRLGAGGPVGSGRQWVSWIHRDDLVDLLLFALREDRLAGPVNATAPEPVRNADFGKALGHAVGRWAITPAPGFALRLVFGEMASVLLESQRVLPRAAENAGWRCPHPTLGPALAGLLG